MSLTYIRLASGFSISGSSYSLIEQQITIRRANDDWNGGVVHWHKWIIANIKPAMAVDEYENISDKASACGEKMTC